MVCTTQLSVRFPQPQGLLKELLEHASAFGAATLPGASLGPQGVCSLPSKHGYFLEHEEGGGVLVLGPNLLCLSESPGEPRKSPGAQGYFQSAASYSRPWPRKSNLQILQEASFPVDLDASGAVGANDPLPTTSADGCKRSRLLAGFKALPYHVSSLWCLFSTGVGRSSPDPGQSRWYFCR